MDSAPDIATILHEWLGHLGASAAPSVAKLQPIPFREIGAPANPDLVVPALAALAAEALARDRTLWIVTADDAWLPDISNALDLRLRPLCLVLPGADHAERIALRATLSLLKSRLARDAEDSVGPAWTALRERLRTDDALWRAALAWTARGLDRELPPEGVASLFPVRIGPWQVAERCAAPADWVMLVQSGGLPASLRTPWSGALHTLMLAGAVVRGGTALASVDAAAQLRAEIEVLGQELAEMELEFATAQGELAAFSERYQTLIAGRMAELDSLHAELARLQLRCKPEDAELAAATRRAEAQAEQSRRESAFHRRDAAADERAFRPGIDLKKRFRQLAQKIHPDRASDEADRAWRTQLMSEANRAYRNGDAAALDEILALWLEGRAADAVPPAPTFAAARGMENLARQVAAMRARIAAITGELDRLYGSKLYELFAAARVAARQERDLLAEMAAQLDTRIAAAQAALAAAA